MRKTDDQDKNCGEHRVDGWDDDLCAHHGFETAVKILEARRNFRRAHVVEIAGNSFRRGPRMSIQRAVEKQTDCDDDSDDD